MDIKHYFKAILNRIWIIAAIPAAASIMSAYISYYVMVPIYEASTTFYIINRDADIFSSGDYEGITLNKQVVKDCSDILKSKRVSESMVNELEIEDVAYSEIGKKLSIGFKNDTNIIQLKVRDTDAERAAMIAEKAREKFMMELEELTGISSLHIVDEVEKADKPVSPRPVFNTGAAFLTGLILALGFVLLLSYFDNTIKTSADVEKHLGLVVLGRIPLLDMK